MAAWGRGGVGHGGVGPAVVVDLTQSLPAGAGTSRVLWSSFTSVGFLKVRWLPCDIWSFLPAERSRLLGTSRDLSGIPAAGYRVYPGT